MSVRAVAALLLSSLSISGGKVSHPAHGRHVLDGHVETRFANGQVASSREYRSGREEGEHRGWYENGQPRFVYHYRDGLSEGVSYEWDIHGQLIHEAHYLHGREEGVQRMWDAKGKLRANYVMKDGIRYGKFGATGCAGDSMTSRTQ